MPITGRLSGVVAVAALLLPGPGASAEVRTSVTHAGPCDSSLRSGLPVLDVRVTAAFAVDVAFLEAGLERDLEKLVYSRPVADGDPSDFILSVSLGRPRVEPPATRVAFEVRLTDASGAVPWQVAGESEVRDEPLDARAVRAISRSVLAALIHDEWVQPRYDPGDPPPEAPVLRPLR